MSFGSRPLGGFGTQSTLTNSSLLSGSTTQAPAAGTLQDLQNDITIPDGPEDSISDLSFSPVSDFISVASWDKKNRIYEVNPRTGSIEGRALYEHEGPILSTRWSFNGTKVISGGADKQVKIFDLQSQQHQTVGVHNGPVKSVRYVTCGSSNTECIVSGSWDKTIKYWDMRQQNSICTLNMPERVYAMDASQKLLVVATAERHVVIINLNSPENFFRQSMSPLKYQTRSISCYPKGDGFAIGSIEGRCGIQYVDELQQKQFGFSFKCQRDQKTTTKETLIYSLNSIAFHPVHGTFVTAGADGTFNFWDKDAKHRLKGYPSLNATIPVVGFNASGSIFAYALSYDWSKGHEYNIPTYPNIVRLHACKDEEVKQRQKRK